MSARRTPAALALALTLTALAACAPAEPAADPAPAAAGTSSWAPAPQVVDGLSTLASTVDVSGTPHVALHTEQGDITFWGGVNMGATIPGTNPGELAVPA